MSDDIQFNSRVGNDGVLNVQINLGHTEANRMTWLLDTNVCIRHLNRTSPSLRAKLASVDPSDLMRLLDCQS